MLWKGQRQSDNVEDQRSGMGRGGIAIGGGLGGLVILIIALLLGADPRQLLQQNPGVVPNNQQSSRPANKQDDEMKQFVSTVLASTEDVWTDVFKKYGQQYRKPKLVLYSGQIRSACGEANAAVGPFYCPGDEKVYLDLSFFQELQQRFRAPGDFAEAYVIAHEVGHHVQNLLGTMDKVDRAQQRGGKAQANQLSVRLELQADFLAGVWAHYAQQKGVVEPGDIEEALGAASAVGDDRLQRASQGYVVPDSFTHGSSEQRMRWFRKGLETGDLKQGDTFSATNVSYRLRIPVRRHSYRFL
ncbi:MAG TPA: neutral zinc metallopeptidase [Pyrinomonadaceae bacterium]|nr:neutral zinc metallopeptidase [Pyrinomonadaceae bacterium]